MKRFHVHVAVDDLQQNIRFYSALFGMRPSVEREDYAKWMVDDPLINFAISARGHQTGINHVGIQVDSDAELKEMKVRLIEAHAPVLAQREAACCYARSDKHWITDPQGTPWETYHTLESIPVFGEDSGKSPRAGQSAACCPAG